MVWDLRCSVSGGGIEFMRVWMEKVLRLPELDFNDNKGVKPVAIQKFIGAGQLPPLVTPMVIYKCFSGHQRLIAHFALIVHHTDAESEVAYDLIQPLVVLIKPWMNRGKKVGQWWT